MVEVNKAFKGCSDLEVPLGEWLPSSADGCQIILSAKILVDI